MALKLVSFTVCPFVQRAVLMLREKDTAFDVEYIDLADKPEWFLKLSPRGKVPILVVDGRDVLFESQAICEYLEETIPEPALMPADPVGRARDRAWFPFAGEDVFVPLWRIETAKTDDALADAKASLHKALGRLEEEMQGRAWLSGDGTRFGLADVAMAPAFTRMQSHRGRGVDLLEAHPTVAAWGARILARDAVKRSIPDRWAEDHAAYMKKHEAVLA